MQDRNIRRVAIIGSGVAGSMSAAFLAHMLKQTVAITLIDIGEQHEAVFDQASLPPLKAFHQILGIEENDVIANTQGSMKLGTQFVNWGTLGNRYFHPHGNYGAEFDAVPLHQWWLKARAMNEQIPTLAALSMAGAMAVEGRFSVPLSDRRLIQSTFDYAYHMDSQLYAEFLSAYAIKCGVIKFCSTLSDVVRHGESGFITQVSLADGRAIEADLFIDCSGQQSLLADVSSSGFDGWSGYLPCNRAVAVSCARGGEFSPYTRVTARDAGWQWRIPLQHNTSMGYVFDSSLISDDDAISSLMDNLDGRSLGEPHVTSFVNGKNRQPFTKNVVSLGASAGVLEPLEATGLHLIQAGLTRLLSLWPTKACESLLSDEYNQITANEWDLARDFLVLHYKASKRTDSPLWQHSKDMAIPESLQARLAHWQTFGRLISPRPELFQAASWLSVLIGQGMIPTTYDPLADARGEHVDFEARLLGLERIIAETASQLPHHRDWIDKNARGPKA